MGNSLCCISSKPHLKHQTSSLSNRTPQLRLKKGSQSNVTAANKYKGHHNRQSEIDYYYDDYEELAHADSSTLHLTKKAKKAKGNQPKKQTTRQNSKLSNKPLPSSYYAQDLRLQDGKLPKTPTQATILNTSGLDTKSQASSAQLRDNSKIISHLSSHKLTLANNNQSSVVPNRHGNGSSSAPQAESHAHNNVNSALQIHLVNTVKLNNQLLINPNNTNSCNLKQNEIKSNLNEQPPKPPSDTSSLVVRDNASDLCSTSTSSILATSSSSQISSKSSRNSSSIQYANVQSQSSTYIDPKKSLLRHITEMEGDFESEPNLNVERWPTPKKDNARKLINRTRGSSLNQSLNETSRQLASSYSETTCDSSEVNLHVQRAPADESNNTNTLVELNCKKYKSLQKSKRSIQNLEETMKSSRSIEQWLNDFSKLDRDGDMDSILIRRKGDRHSGPQISKRKLVKLDKIKRSHTSLDENDENNFNAELNCQSEVINSNLTKSESPVLIKKKLHTTDSTTSSAMHLDITTTSNDSGSIGALSASPAHNNISEFSEDSQLKTFLGELANLFSTNNSAHPQTCQKLFDTIEALMQANRPRTIKKTELRMAKDLGDFMLPKSNANSDDIDMLKWLLDDKNTLNLKLINPVISETVYTNDHLTYSSQQSLCYLLIANSLKVKLMEPGSEKNINNEYLDTDDLDSEKLETMLSGGMSGSENDFVKFVLDTTYNDGEQVPSTSGELILEKALIEALLTKEKQMEKKMASRMGVIIDDSRADIDSTDIDFMSDKELLDQLKVILSTSNFKGAQCLYNIKRKQLMNRKTVTMNSLLKKQLLSPISVNTPSSKRNRSNTSSGTTSPSSSSISPTGSNRMSNNNTLIDSSHNDTDTTNGQPSSFIQVADKSSQFLVAVGDEPSSADSIKFSDLNERLFACLLSNFSCQLVESFLKNSSQALPSSGFIRKKKNDKSFQYIKIAKKDELSAAGCELNGSLSRSPSKHHNLNSLQIEKNSFKLCLKLDKWPASFQQGFFNRKRISKTWPRKNVLEDIYSNHCLISYHEPVELDQDLLINTDYENQTLLEEQKLNISNRIYANSARWQLNTMRAESSLFESLSKQDTFQFYFFYLVFMNVKVQLSESTRMKLRTTKPFSPNTARKVTAQSAQFYLFSFINERIFMHHYFRFLEIEEDHNLENASVDRTLTHLISQLKKFSNYLNFILDKYNDLNQPNYFDMNKPILSQGELKSMFQINFNFDVFATYELVTNDIKLACLHFSDILTSNLVNKQPKKTPASLVASLSTFLDTIQLRLPNTACSSNMQISPLPAHYSANTYLYEYVHEYASVIYDQFKTKRDQFKISEALLLQLHKKVLMEKFASANASNPNLFVSAIEQINPDQLFSKFEEYAECVHKYLPQIRSKNQYLLFHYFWTMQVQYMAPFFNYLCDFYLQAE